MRKIYTRKPPRRIMHDYEVGPFPLERRFISFCQVCDQMLESGELTVHATCALASNRVEDYVVDFALAQLNDEFCGRFTVNLIP